MLHHREREHWAVCEIWKLVAILELYVIKHIVEEKSHPGIKSSLREVEQKQEHSENL